jgi:hypothetical protein
MDDPWFFHDGDAQAEVACSWIDRTGMDAYMAFFLEVLEASTHLGDILHIGRIIIGFVLVQSPPQDPNLV